LLVFQTPDLPAPLTTLSPWLDMLLRPTDVVHRHLASQPHRRFIKTHTPLDGLPQESQVTYVVTGRDPRDMAISLHHQSANLDRERIRTLLGQPADATPRVIEKDDRALLLEWINDDTPPSDGLDGLRGVLWHLGDAWSRRTEPNVLLVHYADLLDDLDAEMRRIASVLRIEVDEGRWPALVGAARFESMRGRADELVPDDRAEILKDNREFFRSGRSGQWRTLLTDDEVAQYFERISTMAPPDLIAWLHR